MVKVTPWHAWADRGQAEVYPQPIRNPVREGWGRSAPRSARFTPGKDPAPVVQEAGWASGQLWMARKISPPQGFDPRKFQPLSSRCTDYAISRTSHPHDGGFLTLYSSNAFTIMQCAEANRIIRVKSLYTARKSAVRKSDARKIFRD
jgi:hypothetical protein